MSLWRSYCGDTSLHGYQYLGRGERSPLWLGVILLSLTFATYFLVSVVLPLHMIMMCQVSNTTEYLASSTVTSLDSSTSSLASTLFPSITVCSRAQIRHSWWMAVGLQYSTENSAKRTNLLNNFFTGTKFKFTQNEINEMRGVMMSAKMQKQFCDYLQHTSNIMFSYFKVAVDFCISQESIRSLRSPGLSSTAALASPTLRLRTSSTT